LALRIRFKLLAATVFLVAACGDKTEDSGADEVTAPLLTAATLGNQTVLTAAEYLSAIPYSSADRSKGARQAQVCRACHSLDNGGPNMIGPALYGFFGSRVGSRAGFEYSPVLRDADFVWTPRALEAWLAQPSRFLPGNRMTFAGVLQSSDREDLIAYLLEVTTADGGS
jgi:cytochrome c